ncbi:DUF4330 domain-containing protein [Natrinema salifodinae]|uniref:DUF4330 family protein n=1 Tax=Natrinema salifodinae TaxID=1202768 RepID=A0A1I0M083_9EURY|nr:DUF4330 domain-containing protein [Natrinema salifodinae]SEV81837.1 protein of unknown function [Natrinema salifodinae]
MPLIDDEGNLFGVVNVIDALAVCLVLAVLVAGIAVVGVLGDGTGTSGPEAETEDDDASQQATRYATIDLGTQPDYVADAIEEGDQAAVATDGHNLTITDVHVSPTNGGDGHVVVRAEIDGEYPPATADETAFRFNNGSVRIDSAVTIDTTDYERQGTVQRLEDEGPTLRTERTTVQLEANVSATTADAIEAGDEFRFAGRTVATVTDVATTELENTSRETAELEVDLVTVTRAGTQTFGDRSVETGSHIPIRTDRYDLTGEVVRRGPSVPIDESE